MENITLQEWCELRLFMIADNNYTSEEIKDELSKYTVIDLDGGVPMLNSKLEIVGI
jgi:hypothetical protein